MLSRILFNPLFVSWAIINLLVGLLEVYAYVNHNLLRLEYETLWEKIAKGKITLFNFWLEGWSEYCKVDSRYIAPGSIFNGSYVWYFELLNAFLSLIFIFALAFENILLLKIILFIGIINCLGYFMTLALETIYCRLESRFSRVWQYPMYYLISGIWLIVPLCCYEIISKL